MRKEKKPMAKYTFTVIKRLCSYSDVYEDETFTISIQEEVGESRRAAYRAEKIIASDYGSSSSYKFKLNLEHIEVE